MKKSDGIPYPYWVRTREHTIIDRGVRLNKLCKALTKALVGEREALKYLGVLLPVRICKST